jgi:hypothetical protein
MHATLCSLCLIFGYVCVGYSLTKGVPRLLPLLLRQRPSRRQSPLLFLCLCPWWLLLKRSHIKNSRPCQGLHVL